MLNLDPIETIVYSGDYKGSNQCPICNFRLLNPQYMKKHIYVQHLKYKWFIDLNEQREKARTTDPLPCPYCGELLYDLSRHITVVHKKSLRQFHLEFPTTPLTSLRRTQEQDLNCEVCGKAFKFKNALGKHIKDCPPEVFNANRQKEDEEYRLKYKDTHTCPICNQKKFNLKINYNIYELCRNMLDSDNMKITHINFHKNSTILSEITPDYKTHKNIIFKTLTKGKKMKWKDISSAEVIPHEGFVYDIELKDNHYFAANSIISHNCRLRNEVTDNEFSYSLGAGGVATGSKNVITININRLIQDNRDIVEEVRKVHKYQLAFEDLYQEYFKSNMMPLYSGGFISLDKQYLTIGINGVVEAAEYLGYEISDNQPYKDWVSSLLKKIYDENRKAAKEYGIKFNTEFTPSENLGVKNAMWDKADGYKVSRDCYNSYLYKVEDNEISVLDKFALHGKQTTQYLDGGSAYHCNLESYPTQEGFKKLIDVAVKEGCEYFCFNVLITGCDDCGHIDKQTLQQCPKCKSNNIWHATRVIGYLKKISDFSTARQNEASLRYYDNKTK